MNIKTAVNQIIFSFFILALIFSPLILMAADPYGPEDSPVKKMDDVIRILNKIVGWTYTIFFVVAAFFILYAAFTYLTAAENAENIQKAHKQIIYAIIAIVIALLSFSFDVIISNFLK